MVMLLDDDDDDNDDDDGDDDVNEEDEHNVEGEGQSATNQDNHQESQSCTALSS